MELSHNSITNQVVSPKLIREGGVDETRLQLTIERAREYDPEAWESLYRRAYPRLFAYARRRVQSEHEADDAVSEAFARAMGAIGGFRWSRAGFDG